MSKKAPDVTQRANCLRLKALFETIDQNTYRTYYQACPMRFLLWAGAGEFPFFAKFIGTTHCDALDELLDETFFDPDYLFFDHISVQKWMIEERLDKVANLPVPPKSMLNRLGDWIERKLCCIPLMDP